MEEKDFINLAKLFKDNKLAFLFEITNFNDILLQSTNIKHFDPYFDDYECPLLICLIYNSLHYNFNNTETLTINDFYNIITENFIIDDFYESLYAHLSIIYSAETDVVKKNFLRVFIQLYLLNIYNKIKTDFICKNEEDTIDQVTLDNKVLDQAASDEAIKYILQKFPNAFFHPQIIFELIKYKKNLTEYIINDDDLKLIFFSLFSYMNILFIHKQINNLSSEETLNIDKKIEDILDYIKNIPNYDSKLISILDGKKINSSLDFCNFISSKLNISINEKIQIKEKKYLKIINNDNINELINDLCQNKLSILIKEILLLNKTIHINAECFFYIICENIKYKFDNHLANEFEAPEDFKKLFYFFCISKKFSNNITKYIKDNDDIDIIEDIEYFMHFLNEDYKNLKKFTNTNNFKYFFNEYFKIINSINFNMDFFLEDAIKYIVDNNICVITKKIMEKIYLFESIFPNVIEMFSEKPNKFFDFHFDKNKVNSKLINLISKNYENTELKNKNIEIIKKLNASRDIFSHLEPILDSGPKEYVVAGHGNILKNSYFVVPDNVTIVFLTENTKITWIHIYNRISGLPFDNSDISKKKEILQLILNYGIGRIYPSGYLVPNTKIDFDFSWKKKTPDYYSIFSGLIEDTDFDKKVTDVTNSGLGLLPTLQKLDELNDISGCTVRFSKSTLNLDPITKEKTLNGEKILSDIITPNNIIDYLKGKDPTTPVIFYILSCRSGDFQTFEQCRTAPPIPLPLHRSPSASYYTELGLSSDPTIIKNFASIIKDNIKNVKWNLGIRNSISNLIKSNYEHIYTTDYSNICNFYRYFINNKYLKINDKEDSLYKTKYLKYKNKYLSLKKKLNNKV
jgi:hypothetical protein